MVLSRLQEWGVSLRRDKCRYISNTPLVQGIHTSDQNVKAIVDAPVTQNVQELRSFLGLLNYYGKFLLNLAASTAPSIAGWSTQVVVIPSVRNSKEELSECTIPSSLWPTGAHYFSIGIWHRSCDIPPDVRWIRAPSSFRLTLTSSELNYPQVER